MQPDRATLKTFKDLGFDEWLRRVKKDASVAATLTQLAEFVAWWKDTRTAPAIGTLELLVSVATVEKRAPEAYNTYLHKKAFRPASILNRIDAVCYALLFMRAKLPGGDLCEGVNFMDILDTIRSIKLQLQREKSLAQSEKLRRTRS